MEYILIFISAIFVNNIVLSQFLGICPFLGVSKKVETAMGMSAAVAFVLTIATIVTFLIQKFVLDVFGLGYLQTITFILVIAGLVHARMLVLMTSTEGIYQDPADPATLVRDVTGKTVEEVAEKVHLLQQSCVGASRAGANGARAKLAYALESVRNGSTVIIGHARHHLSDLVQGRVPCTRIGVE